uniref:Uncharacterized protein n=1 Tax=Cyclophora tenuis TaxID=216820 RepID=A0A7S1GJH1_CYCTE|mmetsp:Transcript_14792/g.25069  ORF Transcript_14792/g.25069 Transcript_14792/m.25069 type:complete len:196 (+) Transcript_14792:3-590(+)
MRQSGSAVPTLSLIVSSIAWFFMCSSPAARRKAPLKWQLLALFTLGESIAVGFISSFYRFSTVLSALSATGIATLGVSAYTILNRNAKYDLSQWGAGLSSMLLVFLFYSVIHLLEVVGVLPAGFLPYREGVFSFIGACLFSAFLAYDTKLIVGGKHSKYQMNDKDYVFGAMSIYVDIVNIFIYIMRAIGGDSHDD